MSAADIEVRAADLAADARAWGRMRRELWPDEDVETTDSLRAALEPPEASCVLLAFVPDGSAVGFAEAKLRRDYVNGTETSPVGFLEGWYVAREWRGRGVGRALVRGVEAWTLRQGCTELASDALLDNSASHAAHRACGFEETDRVVYFRKLAAP